MTADRCPWCGKPGHLLTDHPLRQSHPAFDPELDDNPVMDLALAAFVQHVTTQTEEDVR